MSLSFSERVGWNPFTELDRIKSSLGLPVDPWWPTALTQPLRIVQPGPSPDPALDQDCPFCLETMGSIFCRCNYTAEYAALAFESPVAFASPVVHFGGR